MSFWYVILAALWGSAALQAVLAVREVDLGEHVRVHLPKSVTYMNAMLSCHMGATWS